MSKSRIKRLAAAVFSMTLAISAIPFGVYAAEEQKHITVDGSIEGDYRILERGDELLFSAKDLAEISGFSYLEEDGQIILSRGAKDVRIDPKKSQMYLLEGTGADTDRKLKTKPVEEDGDWFLPGSEVLPQLNISIFSTEGGILCVSRDIVSIWDIYEDFDAKDYIFDFARACTNMGIETNGTKVLAALNNKGILGNVVGWVPFENESSIAEFATYNSIFEDMLFESDSSVKMWNTIWENEEVIDERKKILELTENAADVTNVPVEIATHFFKEFGKYAVLADQTEVTLNDKLAMLKAVGESYGGVNHYPPEIRLRASNTRASYDSFDVIGAITRALESFPEFTLDVANFIDLSIWVDPFYKSLDLPAPIFAEELKDVDNAVYYEVLSNCARAAFEDYGMEHGTDCFRHHAMIYMYACEYSWRAMAEYAKRLKSSYADDFEFIADTCLERKGELYACAASSANDNRGFDEKSDAEESKRLKEVFASITKRDEAGPQLSIKENSSRSEVSVGTGEGDKKAGSNNLNMNYIKDDYCNFPATCMVSDGENLFMTMPSTLAFGVTGILRYPLTSAVSSMYDGTLVYEITIPEDQLDPSLKYPEYGEPIAIGMYDKENLCVVMPTGERDYDFDKGTSNDVVRLEKIPAFDVTYAGEGNVYDTFTMTECVERPKLVGEWFYFERDLESGVHGLFRRSIYSGKEEQIAEHYVGYREETGVERLTYILDEESLIAIRYNNQKSEMLIMDIGNGSIESVELDTEGEVVGVYDGYVYFTGEPANYKLPLYRMKKELWEPELVLTNTSYGYRYNFYQNTMFLLSDDDVFVIPLDAMGRDYSDYEKIHIYTAVSVELAPPLPDSGIWIWDGKIWTYSCSSELNSTLKVLGECEGIISQFTAQMEAQEIQESVEETEPLNDGNELNLSGIYSIGSMSDDAPAIQFHLDTETVQIWNFDIFSFTEQKECYLVAGYRVVDGGIEISAPYGYEFYQVESTNDGITISKDGVSHFFEKAPTF